jgi:hypothetical protein
MTLDATLNASLRQLGTELVKRARAFRNSFRRIDRQLWEAATIIAAIDSFQRGEKDQLRKWVEERNGGQLAQSVRGNAARRDLC